MITIDDILCESNIQLAIDYLARKSDRPGTDGVRLSQVGEYWATNKENIKETIYQKQYEPGIAIQFEQLNKKAKKRKCRM